MKVVIGLGNPGSNYEGSRHNVGFRVVNSLSLRLGIPVKERRFHSLLGLGIFKQQEVLLVKPLTYMNNSGVAVKEILDGYCVGIDSLLVVCDDMDLDLGRVRIRQKGSSGGHNGLKSIIEMIGTEDFARIRVGIGRPAPGLDSIQHVLGWFSPEEMPVVNDVIEMAADAAELCIIEDVNRAMNRYNGLFVEGK